MTRVSIAKEAEDHLEKIEAFALESGSAIYEVVLEELLEMIALLEHHPEMGAAFVRFEGDLTRRMFMDRSSFFLYYEYDSSRNTVIIKDVWYAGRGSLPPLPWAPRLMPASSSLDIFACVDIVFR